MCVRPSQQLHAAVRLPPQEGIVACCQKIRPQAAGIVEQVIEANVPIAGQTRVGRKPGAIAINEEVDHLFLERRLDVDQIEWHAQPIGHAAGIVHALLVAALVSRAFPARHLRPQPHHHADAAEPLFRQKSGRDRAVDAPAHCDNDRRLGWSFAFPLHCCLVHHGRILTQPPGFRHGATPFASTEAVLFAHAYAANGIRVEPEVV